MLYNLTPHKYYVKIKSICSKSGSGSGKISEIEQNKDNNDVIDQK